jgi:hypothetical protein
LIIAHAPHQFDIAFLCFSSYDDRSKHMSHSDLTRGFETLDVNADLSTQHGIELNGGFGTSGGDREIG